MAAALLLAFLLAAGIQVTVQQKCHTRDLEGCFRGLGEYASNNDIPLPTNKEELDKQCVILKNVRECTYNYSLKCVSEMTRTIGNIILLPVGQRMRDFCTEGHETNQKYLDNSQCIRDNYDGVNPCVKEVLAMIEALPKREWKDRLPTFCCGIGQFRSCLQNHFLKACNQDVADLIEMIIEFGVSDVVVEACSAMVETVNCSELPTNPAELDGSYKNNILGELLHSFIRE